MPAYLDRGEERYHEGELFDGFRSLREGKLELAARHYSAAANSYESKGLFTKSCRRMAELIPSLKGIDLPDSDAQQFSREVRNLADAVSRGGQRGVAVDLYELSGLAYYGVVPSIQGHGEKFVFAGRSFQNAANLTDSVEEKRRLLEWARDIYAAGEKTDSGSLAWEAAQGQKARVESMLQDLGIGESSRPDPIPSVSEGSKNLLEF